MFRAAGPGPAHARAWAVARAWGARVQCHQVRDYIPNSHVVAADGLRHCHSAAPLGTNHCEW